MAFSISPYFSDESVEQGLRAFFDYREMWNINFKALLSQIVDVGTCFQLKIYTRTFNIDKITGTVTEVNL